MPYKNEHPCFGQQQEWQCRNLATWRVDGQHVMLHWCDDCKKRVESGFAGDIWYQLEARVETEAEREERIYNDVFKPGESDAAYALRRMSELGGKPDVN